MSKTRASSASQPRAVCFDCGKKYGCDVKEGASSYWTDKCGVCHKTTLVTDPRDFGYLNRDYLNHART